MKHILIISLALTSASCATLLKGTTSQELNVTGGFGLAKVTRGSSLGRSDSSRPGINRVVPTVSLGVGYAFDELSLQYRQVFGLERVPFGDDSGKLWLTSFQFGLTHMF